MEELDVSAQEYQAIAEWVDGKLRVAFGPPFHWADPDGPGVWHIPREPIAWDIAGLTLFASMGKIEKKFVPFAEELRTYLLQVTLRWTFLAYEQRRHGGQFFCSAEPVAEITRERLTFREARFVRDETFIPNGARHAT